MRIFLNFNTRSLSSWLGSASQDHKYRSTYAAPSIEFVKTFLSNGTMVFDSLDYGTCSLTRWEITYNGGNFLKSLGAYYRDNVSSVPQEDLEYINELAASLILAPIWTNSSSGVNIEDAITPTTSDLPQKDNGAEWKAILLDGLYECLSAGFLNDTVADLTRKYIAVQFNAVRELANFTTAGTVGQQYGPSWNGSIYPITQYQANGQLSASMLFTTALGVGPQAAANSTGTANPNPSTSGHTPSSGQNTARTKSFIGTVVGGVVAGIVALTFIAGGLYLRRRRRTAAARLLQHAPHSDVQVAEPYFETTDQYPVTERSLAFTRSDGVPGYLTKRERTTHGAPTSSSGLSSSSSTNGVSVEDQRRDDGTIRVDASALQRLLISIGWPLSDTQRRVYRHDGESSSVMNEPPPGYDEGGSNGR
ncbi:unnamed protein product [Peniophora sp. CBMAI 1063]|nr:unnamed protein product [Peniophora sp. CBMAI 1063]